VINVLINLGYNNLVSAERVVAIINPNSVPAKRLRDDAKKTGLLIDATSGHRLRSMIISSSKHVILTSVEVKTLASRYYEACLRFHSQIGNPIIDEPPDSDKLPDLHSAVQSLLDPTEDEQPKRRRSSKKQDSQNGSKVNAAKQATELKEDIINDDVDDDLDDDIEAEDDSDDDDDDNVDDEYGDEDDLDDDEDDDD
jgi:regulator of extracellular matrix RemA (YlzA/DUF370 family)